MRKNKTQFAIIGIFFLTANMAFAQTNCDNPAISVQNNKNQAASLKHHRADTLVIRVSCLQQCKVIATSKTISIRRLADGGFIFRPQQPGKHKVVVRTSCPEGTALSSGLNMSGTTNIGSFTLEAAE